MPRTPKVIREKYCVRFEDGLGMLSTHATEEEAGNKAQAVADTMPDSVLLVTHVVETKLRSVKAKK